jgi:hypothetical protein
MCSNLREKAGENNRMKCLYSPHNMIRMIKTREMRWAGRERRVPNRRNAHIYGCDCRDYMETLIPAAAAC